MLKRARITGLSVLVVAVITAVVVGVAPQQQPELRSAVAEGQLLEPAAVMNDVSAITGRSVAFNTPLKSNAGFVHPGVFVDQSQLAFIKAQLAANPSAAPWASVMTRTDLAKGDTGQIFGSLAYVPRPSTSLNCEANTTACDYMQDDAISAYTHALKYSYSTASDRAKYANKAISILNAWSSTLTSPSVGNGVRLQTAFAAGMFAQAAEIIRYTYIPADGQPVLNSAALSAMFTNVFVPTIQTGDPFSNGNWELSMAYSMINMGVFNDDRAIFDQGLALWRQRVPAYIYMTSDGSLPNPVPGGKYDTTKKLNCYWAGAGTPTENCTLPAGFSYRQGMVQETCRDMAHVALGLRAMMNGAETAYLQGVNLYGEQKDRILAAHEFSAQYDVQFLNSGSVPSWLCGGKLLNNGVGYKLGWEVGYNHYHGRLGESMPYTNTFITTITRPTTYQADQLSAWPTLTHAGVEAPAGCINPDRRLGVITRSVDAPADGTYRLWTRVKPAVAGVSEHALQVDGACPVRAGGTQLPANEWSWIDHQNGDVATKTNLTLSAGTHTLTLTGVTQGLAIDSVLLLSDPNCVPTGNGDNCTNPADTIAPVATLINPTAGEELRGITTLRADASDNREVSEVKFYLGGVLLGSVTTAPYSVTWDTTATVDGPYVLSVQVFDAAGNTTSSSPISITVQNLDVTPPSVPGSLTSPSQTSSDVSLTWEASIDNFAVTNYLIYRGTELIATLPGRTYTDTGLSAETSYVYSVKAADASGNVSAATDSLTVTTQQGPDVTAPTTPASVSTAADSPNSVTIQWDAATDDRGVTGYQLLRNGTILATLDTTLTYTDTTVAASTAYTYSVRAKDAAGNLSTTSMEAAVTTPAPPDTTAPTIPGDVTVVANSPTSATITWTASNDNVGVSGYELLRGGEVIATFTTQLMYTDSTLTQATTYSYSVRAKDAAGNVSAASAQQTVTTPLPPDVTAPSIPADFVVSLASPTRAVLRWAPATDDRGVTGYQIIRNGVLIATINSLSYDDSGLEYSTDYVYVVRAIDAAGNVSAAPTSASVTTPLPPDVTAPSVPTSVSTSANSPTSVTITWNASTDDRGVTGYELLRGGVQIATLGTQLNYTDTTVTAATTYTYSIRAKDAAGNVSTASASASITTPLPPDTTAPSVPTGLAVSLVSPTSATLSWTAATDDRAVTGYRISRNGVQIAEINTLSYSDNGLQYSTTYTYVVRAIDAVGNVSAASTQQTVTTPLSPDVTAPSVPTSVNVRANSSSSVTVSWNASTDDRGVTSYELLRGGVQIVTLGGSQLTYTDSTVTASTTYTYSVRAKDAAGNVSAASTSASVTTPLPPDTTAPSAPSNPTALLATGTQVSLSWSAASDNLGVTAYRINRGGTQIAQITGTTYTDTATVANTTYSYSIVAVDGAGNVGLAASTSVTVPAARAAYAAGFTGAYFNNIQLSGPAIERNDDTINFNWGLNSPLAGIGVDNFSARWTGQLTPTQSGTYTFYTEASDGVRLWVNDQLIIDRWSGPSSTLSATYQMTANAAYNIRLEYFEVSQSAYAKLLWSGPGVAKAPIPSSVVKSGIAGLSASYYANTDLTGTPTLMRLDNTINNSWGTGSPDTRLPIDNFSVRWVGKIKPATSGTYTFSTDTADGVRLWVNGQLLVNNWTAHPLTTNSATITLTAGTLYDIRMEYQSKTNSSVAKLSWAGPGFTKTIVPASVLRDR